MKKMIKDYAIYMMTIVMCASLLIAFLSIAFSKEILMLSDNMTNLRSVLIILSVLVMLIFAFLIQYAMQFIIKRRRKEFGMYMLLGVENKTIFKLFLLENIILGFASFAVSIPIGYIIYQALNVMIMTLFDRAYHLAAFSLQALLWSAGLFLIVYVINAIKSSRRVARMKIKDLIDGARYNEMPQIKSIKVRLGLIVLYGITLVLSLVLMIKGLEQSSNIVYLWMMAAFLGLVLSVFGLYTSIPLLFYLLKDKLKKWRYKGTNLFLAGQVTSKVTTTSKVMASSAVMLSLALILLMVGLSIGAAYKTNFAYEAPFDVTVSIDADVASFEAVLGFVETKTDVKDSITYNIYESEDVHFNDSIGQASFIKLSDYNHLREMLGLDYKVLPEDSFIIHSESWSVREKIKAGLDRKSTVTIGGISLKTDDSLIFDEPFEQMRTNGNNGYILVIPDKMCRMLNTTKSRFIASTAEPASQSLKGELTQFVRQEWRPAFNYVRDEGAIQESSNHKITMFIGVKSWSIANGLTGLSILSFGAIYMSLILFLIVGTLLALQQLSEERENIKRFELLRKLGTHKNDRLILIKKQVGLYFALPAVIPVILTVAVGLMMNVAFKHFILIQNTILFYTGLSVLIFVIIYGIYMGLSYQMVKKVAE